MTALLITGGTLVYTLFGGFAYAIADAKRFDDDDKMLAAILWPIALVFGLAIAIITFTGTRGIALRDWLRARRERRALPVAIARRSHRPNQS